jgi:uncharacterized protein YbjQ (UPF0145 family)
MATCVDCDTKLTILNKSTAERCYPCAKAELQARQLLEQSPADQNSTNSERISGRDPAIEAIIVTTEAHTDLVITERLGVVTAECAYGMNAFKDLFASVRNVFGGRSKAVQATMRNARETALYELKEEAARLGADAVIAVDLEYVQIGDGGWSMVMLVASGTAVKVG